MTTHDEDVCLVYCTNVDVSVYPVIMQGTMMGHGEMEREELIALLPAGEKLRPGHYRLVGDKAIWLGLTVPEGLLT